jgi:hypothetical protein
MVLLDQLSVSESEVGPRTGTVDRAACVVIGNFNPMTYNSLWQLRGTRGAAWRRRASGSPLLAAAVAQRHPSDRLIEQVSALLDLLEPIKNCWAFPVSRRYEPAPRMFAAGDVERFARLIAGLNRELTTDSYRNPHLRRAFSRPALSSYRAQQGRMRRRHMPLLRIGTSAPAKRGV